MSLTKGLVLHLPLDEQSFNPATKRFTDKSAYSNHGTGSGTILGASPTFQADRIGQLVRATPFNGSDDVVTVNDDNSLDFGTGDFTAGFWSKTNLAVNGVYYDIITKRTDFGSDGFVVSYHGQPGDATCKIWCKIFNISNASISTVSVSTWNHLLLVRESNTSTIYINSIPDKIISTIVGDINNALPIKLGYSGNDYLNGNIAEVRIYNRALNQQEITLLYESYRPGWKI